VQGLANIFRALSDETRLRIIKLLEKGELCVCDIVAALEMVQPKVSFHLAVLKETGFIKDRRQGRWIHYRIDDSDMFRRFLVFAALERIPEEAAREDKRKLDAFLDMKNIKAEVIPLRACQCEGKRR